MPEYRTLEQYAEHIRRETFHLSAQLFRALGTEHPAALRAGALCTEAAAIVTGRQMETERAEIESLDLAALPAVSATSPFDEE